MNVLIICNKDIKREDVRMRVKSNTRKMLSLLLAVIMVFQLWAPSIVQATDAVVSAVFEEARTDDGRKIIITGETLNKSVQVTGTVLPNGTEVEGGEANTTNYRT